MSFFFCKFLAVVLLTTVTLKAQHITISGSKLQEVDPPTQKDRISVGKASNGFHAYYPSSKSTRQSADLTLMNWNGNTNTNSPVHGNVNKNLDAAGTQDAGSEADRIVKAAIDAMNAREPYNILQVKRVIETRKKITSGNTEPLRTFPGSCTTAVRSSCCYPGCNPCYTTVYSSLYWVTFEVVTTNCLKANFNPEYDKCQPLQDKFIQVCHSLIAENSNAQHLQPLRLVCIP